MHLNPLKEPWMKLVKILLEDEFAFNDERHCHYFRREGKGSKHLNRHFENGRKKNKLIRFRQHGRE
jgi:hypothetical protein